ncbi:MAG TPA: ATP-binding protein [Chitinophagaceae bacterium]|nr:ATP-binding protein [Chitinophagaceae bacterium]
MLKKIVIIGPESTGKSTLCEQLAQYYSTIWCPEFAREYLLTYGTNYSYEDLLFIAKGQLAMEDEYKQIMLAGSLQQNKNHSATELLFVDTDMYVMKVWCEFVFNKCHNWILKQITERKYDLYLLCDTDIPWVKDELREYPDLGKRRQLYHIYKDIMINQSTPWIEISGTYEERLKKAVTEIDKLFYK